MESDYQLTVERPVDEVFAVLAAVDRYADWLPPSAMYVRTEIDSEVREGCEYVDHHADGGSMRGVVHIYDPPHRIGFRQERRVALGRAIVRVEYTLTAGDGGTRIHRRHVFSTSWHLRPAVWLLGKRLRRENQRVMEALEKALDKDLRRA